MLKVTILGCGTSAGVPVPGWGWGNCDPNEPRNQRTRSSILIENKTTTILVDTGPDCRTQLLRHDIKKIDAIIYTHTHADHCHGIDDVRWICQIMNKPINIYGYENHLSELQTRFAYAFMPLKEGQTFYNRPVLIPHIVGDDAFMINDIRVMPFVQDHGFGSTLGIRIGNFAYSTDVVALDDYAFAMLDGIEYWVVDALQYKAYRTHAHLDLTLEWIKKIKPKKSWLTHMNFNMDYQTLIKNLPSGVKPAYDGLIIKI